MAFDLCGRQVKHVLAELVVYFGKELQEFKHFLPLVANQVAVSLPVQLLQLKNLDALFQLFFLAHILAIGLLESVDLLTHIIIGPVLLL